MESKMDFQMPKYHAPNFNEGRFTKAPCAKTSICDQDGVLPDYYHSTSMYPEYFKIGGE